MELAQLKAAPDAVREGRGILERLNAAGIGKARPREVIAQEISAILVVLKKLKNEHMRACSRERMAKLWEDPAFRRKRAEGSARASESPDLKARRAANISRFAHHSKLPPMTSEQYRLYHKYRWGAARMTREAALAAILGRAT